MLKRFLSARAYLIVQTGLGTVIVDLAPIFWDKVQGPSMVYFATGVFIILNTLYGDSKRMDSRIRTLEEKVRKLESRLGRDALNHFSNT